MLPSRRLAALVLASFLVPLAASVSVAAAPMAPTIRMPRSSGGSGGGSSVRYVVEQSHLFFAGGMSLPSTSSVYLSSGWTFTAGVEMPAASGWSLVPRLHATGAATQASGTVNWGRLALDGRLSHRRGGVIDYQEAGVGFGVVDAPFEVRAADGRWLRNEQRASGSPSLQLAGGVRGDPDLAPAFQLEIVLALGLGLERPASFEVSAGIAF